MGQKTNPIGMRLNLNRNWASIWYSSKNRFAYSLISDIKIRQLIENTHKSIISKIIILRSAKKLEINILSNKPGNIIGKKGEGINNLSKHIAALPNIPESISIKVKEIKNFEIDANLVAKEAAVQIEKRVSFRRVLKRSVALAMKQGAKGIKVAISGRIGGAEIARTEHISQGRLSLNTLTENVDYAFSPAYTSCGVVGIKVWINREDK